MRKKKLDELLKQTNDELEFTRLENRQLHERIKEFEDSAVELNEKSQITGETLLELENELATLKKKLESQKIEYESAISELEERNNALGTELNHLKGEHFDACKYADDLKEQLHAIMHPETNEENTEAKLQQPAPVIEELVTFPKKDDELFEYASSVISNTVIKTATVKNILANSGDKYAGELMTLALGKAEMVKSDVLQTVMSEMLPEAKKQRMDSILKEANDYFDGLTGQLSE